MDEQRPKSRKELVNRQLAVVGLAAVALAGCSSTSALHGAPQLPVSTRSQPSLSNHNVVILGDSELQGATNSAPPGNNILAKFNQAGFNVLVDNAMAGHSLSGGVTPSITQMIDEFAPQIKKAGIVILEAGTNPSGNISISAAQFEADALVANKKIADYNPDAQRYMVDIADGYAPYAANYSSRNQGLLSASKDKDYGFGIIPMYEVLYGGNAQHINSNLQNASIGRDQLYHVHPQDAATWSLYGEVIVSTVEAHSH